MKKGIIILILNLVVCMASASESPVIGSVVISEKRNAAIVDFKNMSGSDVYCDQLKFKFKVVGNEFGENIGEFTETIKSVYLEPNEEVSKTIGNDLQKFSSPTRAAMLSEVSSDFSQCHVASFVDYCNFAPKTKDELYTLERILDAAKTGRCEYVEANLGERLKLKESGISELKPISYLSKLKELDLPKNNIISVNDLSKLNQLVKIDLSRNPLAEIDSLVTLPNIQKIDASHTNLKYKKWDNTSTTLKKVYVYGTPFEDEKDKNN